MLTTVPVCCESGSKHFSSMYCHLFRFKPPHLEITTEIFSFQSQTCIISNEHIVYWASKIYKLSQPRRSNKQQLSDKMTPLHRPHFTWRQCLVSHTQKFKKFLKNGLWHIKCVLHTQTFHTNTWMLRIYWLMTHAKLRRMHTELRTQDLHSSGMLHRTDW